MCAPSEDSDQPAQPRILISFRYPRDEAVDHWLLIECIAKTNQAVRMRAWVFAGQMSFCTFCCALAHIYDVDKVLRGRVVGKLLFDEF